MELEHAARRNKAAPSDIKEILKPCQKLGQDCYGSAYRLRKCLETARDHIQEIVEDRSSVKVTQRYISHFSIGFKIDSLRNEAL